MNTSGELPCPPEWRRVRPSRVGRVVGAVLTGVVVAVFVLVGLTFAAGAGPSSLLDPGTALDAAVRILQAGPVPWTGAAGVVLLVLAPAVTVGASPGRERLVRTGAGEWALHFAFPVARTWRTTLLGLGFFCLVAVGDELSGSSWFIRLLLALAVVATLGPVVVGAAVAVLAPRRRARIELSGSGFLRCTPTGGRQRVVWADVERVVPFVRSRGEGGAAEYVGLRLRPGARYEDSRWWWGRRVRTASAATTPHLVFAAGSTTTTPERLFWACVAFLDPARREALLDGADVTPAG